MRTGVVLAGGQGSRMGARKPLLEFRGRPLVHWALDALRPHCGELLVMAGRDAALLSRHAAGARVLADPGQGPHVALRLAAGLARGDVVLVAPADAPLLTPETYAALLAAGADAVAVDGEGINPLVGCYRRASLLAHARSLQEVARWVGARRVAVPGDLRDVDTPEDLRVLAEREGSTRTRGSEPRR